MRVSVFGLGYVGTVSAACLARDGHEVIGVDVNPDKVALVEAGASPVIEPGLDLLVADSRASGRLRATSDAASAVKESELSLVCVGTPGRASGGLDTAQVERVSREIGAALAQKPARHVVAIRSTVLPGTTEAVVLPALETTSGRTVGAELGVCVNPEFLREGCALDDYDDPPRTVIGEVDEASGDVVASIYAHLEAPLVRLPLAMAEMVKYCDNTWHALKIAFANEIGNVAKATRLDSHRLMEVFCLDTKLNLSDHYLRPGPAFGGSCLPKDVRALRYYARSLDVETPVVSSILPSNQLQIERALAMVLAREGRRVGVLGLAFKNGTDDLRESPMVELVERLIGKGFDVRIYDRAVSLSALVGANRGYLLEKIPHVSTLLVDSLDELLAHAETLVVGSSSAEFATVAERCRDDQAIVDLVRISRETTDHPAYDGICW